MGCILSAWKASQLAVLAFLKACFWVSNSVVFSRQSMDKKEPPASPGPGLPCVSLTLDTTHALIFLSEDSFPCCKMVVSLPTRNTVKV